MRWGVMARSKVAKLAQIIFNNQQRLVVALEGRGGWHRWGAMTTDDHGGRDTSSLNDVVRVQGQGDRGTTIIRGITYSIAMAAAMTSDDGSNDDNGGNDNDETTTLTSTALERAAQRSRGVPPLPMSRTDGR